MTHENAQVTEDRAASFALAANSANVPNVVSAAATFDRN